MAEVQRLQSRQRYAASGFALSPIRAVFLDSSRWVVEPTVKLLVMRLFTFVPHLLPRKWDTKGPSASRGQDTWRVLSFVLP